MKPPEAYRAYLDAEKVAQQAYIQYWLDEFAKVKLNFTLDPQSVAAGFYQAEYAGYKIDTAYAYPARFEGWRMYVLTKNTKQNYRSWTSVKVKSATGIDRFMRRLERGDFP